MLQGDISNVEMGLLSLFRDQVLKTDNNQFTINEVETVC